jgi:hypothetical protein
MTSFYPIPLTSVTLTDDFWAPRLRANRERTIPIEYQQCRDTGRIDAFRLNWKEGDQPIPHIFWDSDVAKWIEAAAYSLATHPDPQLDALLDEVIALIASAQQPDGYLNTHFTVVEPDKRWTNLRDQHELYCAGHLIEAAVAHFQATGKRALLDVLCRYADYISTVFGAGPGQKRGYPGHEEIELALVKLYRATGQRRYLDLAQYFIDERGQPPYYYDEEARARGDDPRAYRFKTYAYQQAHIPVREQKEVTGHSVRAMYLYSAMADLAGENGDPSLLAACEALWHHLCAHNLYLTGGLGASGSNEGFTFNYDLPNETAYAETCAAIGLVFWNHRLLQLHCDGRYADVMERALYNGVLSGVSLDGERFFYENPLASLGQHHRQAWFDCACCPPNLARLLASLGHYIYAQNDDAIAVHLYVQGQCETMMNGRPITLRQQTRYPWEGTVKVSLTLEQPTPFELRLRQPGWCASAQVSLNGAVIHPPTERGYWVIQRQWSTSDEVTLTLDMPITRVYAHPDVRENAGKVALQRGPLVYCLEQGDHADPLHRLALPRTAELTADFNPNLLDGVVIITGDALATVDDEWADTLYRPQPARTEPTLLTAIPYYAWDNRAPGPMRVWLTEV